MALTYLQGELRVYGRRAIFRKVSLLGRHETIDLVEPGSFLAQLLINAFVQHPTPDVKVMRHFREPEFEIEQWVVWICCGAAAEVKELQVPAVCPNPHFIEKQLHGSVDKGQAQSAAQMVLQDFQAFDEDPRAHRFAVQQANE